METGNVTPSFRSENLPKGCYGLLWFFVTTGFLMNIPIVAIGIDQLINYVSSSSPTLCFWEKFRNYWLIISFGIGCFHIGYILFIAYSIYYVLYPRTQERINNHMKFFLGALLSYTVWLIMGVEALKNDKNCDNIPSNRVQMRTVVGLGIAYIYVHLPLNIHYLLVGRMQVNPDRFNYVIGDIITHESSSAAGATTAGASPTTTTHSHSPHDVENPPSQQQQQTVYVEDNDPPIVYAEAVPLETTMTIPPPVKLPSSDVITIDCNTTAITATTIGDTRSTGRGGGRVRGKGHGTGRGTGRGKGSGRGGGRGG